MDTENKPEKVSAPAVVDVPVEAPAVIDGGGGSPPDIYVPQIPDTDTTFEEFLERIEEVDVSTEPNTAVFYSRDDPVFHDKVFSRSGSGVSTKEVWESGFGSRIHEKAPITSGDIARSYAEQTGRKTLEMTEGGRWLEACDPTKRFGEEKARELWSRLSERFAEGASGEVVAFSRNSADDKRATWIDKELPALEKNSQAEITNFGWSSRRL